MRRSRITTRFCDGGQLQLTLWDMHDSNGQAGNEIAKEILTNVILCQATNQWYSIETCIEATLRCPRAVLLFDTSSQTGLGRIRWFIVVIVLDERSKSNCSRCLRREWRCFDLHLGDLRAVIKEHPVFLLV